MADLHRATIDFETRSACDLKKSGAWKYSEHPTTDAMCLAYLLPGISAPSLWHMAHPQHFIDQSEDPIDLFDYIRSGGIVEAHNRFFEFAIWKNIMSPRYGWPEIPHGQWRCSAAKAAAWCLPRHLEGAAKAAGLNIQKDMAGNRLMLKMCKPRKPRKAELVELTEKGIDTNTKLFWHEEEQDIYRLWEYCKTDVMTEHALSAIVPDLSDSELEIWRVDQKINERGVLFDIDLAHAAIAMADKQKATLNKELKQITGINAATKRQAIKDWLRENEDLDLPDTAKDTLEYIIKTRSITGRARKIIDIILEVNKTSTAKYQAMVDRASDDGRIRDLLMYHGASTGRWSGKGVQVQNFPSRDLIIDDMDQAVDDVKSGDLEWCTAMYGNVMRLLSHTLRGAITAPSGKKLIAGDYSAIEARMVLWAAGAKQALDVFRSGGDIYCDMATGIYGYPVRKKTHPGERQFGKQAILGLGYQMSFIKFLLTCRSYGISFTRQDCKRIMGVEKLAELEQWVTRYLCIKHQPTDKYAKITAINAKKMLIDKREQPEHVVHELALMKYTVDKYRSRYPEVVELWSNQENAAKQAIITGEKIKEGYVSWFLHPNVLYCQLPSGRRLAYQDPKLKVKKTNWGEDRISISYMSVNGLTRKWERTYTYGGKLVENITQANSRDITAYAMVQAEKSGTYKTGMTVHDELVCEVGNSIDSVEDFENLLTNVPKWAKTCPVDAEAKMFKRYRK